MNPSETTSVFSNLTFPSHWPAQADLLQWCQNMTPGIATVLVIGGIIYLLFGYYIFRGLVLLNATFAGAAIGAVIGKQLEVPIPGAIVGAMLLAAVTFIAMKYAVAFMGGIFGVLLGASVCAACGLEPSLAWAGLTGLVAFGLLAFILFKESVMMLTSLQGSVMLILGILGLIYQYQSAAPVITENMQVKPFLLPMMILIPMVLGLVFQQTQKSAAEAEAAKKKK